MKTAYKHRIWNQPSRERLKQIEKNVRLGMKHKTKKKYERKTNFISKLYVHILLALLNTHECICVYVINVHLSKFCSHLFITMTVHVHLDSREIYRTPPKTLCAVLVFYAQIIALIIPLIRKQ